MNFDTDVRLMQITSGTGAAGGEIISDESTVRCKVESIGSNLQYKANAAGVKLELGLVMWRSEFRAFTHAQFGDTKRYRIANVAPGSVDTQIRVNLIRG